MPRARTDFTLTQDLFRSPTIPGCQLLSLAPHSLPHVVCCPGPSEPPLRASSAILLSLKASVPTYEHRQQLPSKHDRHLSAKPTYPPSAQDYLISLPTVWQSSHFSALRRRRSRLTRSPLYYHYQMCRRPRGIIWRLRMYQHFCLPPLPLYACTIACRGRSRAASRRDTTSRFVTVASNVNENEARSSLSGGRTPTPATALI